MLQRYRLPIKGTFYYAAEIAFDENRLTLNTVLRLIAEPDNEYDHHALQIVLPIIQDSSNQEMPSMESLNPHTPGLLLGYVPRQLSSILSHQLKSSCTYSLQVIHRAKLGKRIEIECLLEMHLPWFTALKFRLLILWV
ncbi:HIRAN domain-containing protein [Thiomicrorhabdus arctica]|uniref:HIRAN domain-containing protein n=1 Tax=Thiomicrorhabdus arctica TaxID=131540 RepID=UPI000378D9ED|nr:HIRAN domain-containing protein [Thiomicrorhabdus arctica]